jgi:signal transduction histidine kinase
MLNRLGIRQKLALLLLVPLAAVLLTLVPFTAERVGDAQAAGATARSANAAREIGVLVQDLQQERLLALGFLTTTQLDRSALLARAETVIDEATRLRAEPGTSAVMARAGNQLAALASTRQRLVARTAEPAEVYAAYRDLNNALLDGLRLVNPAGVDAEGLRQLDALDALMRANEEASSVGAVLVAVAGDRRVPRSLLNDALAAQAQYTRRFRQLVSPSRVALLDLVEQGKAGQRINQLIAAVSLASGGAPPLSVVDALTAAVSYTGLRRVAQDRVAREIAAGADERALAARITAGGVAGGAALLFIVMVVLGLTVSRSIAIPLRRLTRAAAMVADLTGGELQRVSDSEDADPAPPKLAAVEINSGDEVGALATAFNRVQATAALLLERQFQARRNVAVMFGNIARRTQNLVGRQIVLLEALERAERSPDVLARYYRLDHLATRLRRSADSLLVLSGTTEQGVGGAPTLLVDVVHAALADVESPEALRVRLVCDVSVSAGLVADLRLLLAELMENATNFSPPAAPVDVSAHLTDECRIEIVDCGLGMNAERLAQENRRLVERERLDVMPTTMLGLFVVGRLARRHGLRVQLQPTPGGGTTAVVTIPLRLLAPASAARAVPRPRVPARFDRPLPPPPLALTSTPFAWFGGPPGTPAGTSAPVVNGAVLDVKRTATSSTGGAPSATSGKAPPPSWPTPAVRPEAPGLAEGVRPGAGAGRAPAAHFGLPRRPELTGRAEEPVKLTRGGLTRRTPGNHLLPIHAQTTPDSRGPARDPLAERAALDSFVAGAARVVEPAPAVPSSPPGVARVAGQRQPATPSSPPGPGPAAAQRETRGGLTRRLPGTHLAPSTQNGGTAREAAVTPRDPNAEREALDGFLAGFARGATEATDQVPQSQSERHP